MDAMISRSSAGKKPSNDIASREMELSKKVVGKAQYDYIARGSTDIQ
jgi:hypothetical protein